MSKKETKTQEIKKLNATIFPFGFGVSKLEDEIIVIDFYDNSFNDSYIITNSIAMPRSKAEGLRDAIDKILNQADDK